MVFDGGIEFLEEGHPLAVVVAAVFVRCPRPLVKVQVKHVRHGIHPQTIQVTFLKPEHGVGNEEALDLVLTQVEVERPPPHIVSPVDILVFKGWHPIIVSQGIGITAEVTRHPVHDDPDAGLVGLVNEVLELFQGPIAATNRIVTGNLITPRSIQRMIHEWHHFDVGVAHFLNIRNQAVCQFRKGIGATVRVATPRTGVHFINVERRMNAILTPLLVHPDLVRPFKVFQAPDHRSILRRNLKVKTKGINLIFDMTITMVNPNLVTLTPLGSLDDASPYPTFNMAEWLILPVIEITLNVDIGCIGGPNGEAIARHSILVHLVTA